MCAGLRGLFKGSRLAQVSHNSSNSSVELRIVIFQHRREARTIQVGGRRRDSHARAGGRISSEAA